MQLKDVSIYGERIREAREINGYSQTTLAELLKLQKATISAYEKDKIRPSSEVLFRISTITKFPIEFFINERPHDSIRRTSAITFRKRSAATKTSRVQGERIEDLTFDIYSHLTKYVKFAEPNIPFFEVDFKTLTLKEIEDIAIQTRRKWGMGDGPIANLSQFLENNGILIGTADLDQKMDAFSTWRSSIPIILLSDNNNSAVRRRYNQAHELGHLILHSTVPEDELENKENHDKAEEQANYFAGAFLLPGTTLYKEYFSNSLTALLHLKKRWKVSVAAIAMRLAVLNCITENQKQYIMIQLSQTAGGRVKEPLDEEIEIETPTLLKDAINLLVELQVISYNQLLSDLMIPDNLFCTITGITPPALQKELKPLENLRFTLLN